MRLESIPVFLMGFGSVFDLFSLIALISTIVSRKFSSGFPGVGLICYALFMLCALVPALRGRITLISALLLGVVLICFHVAMHWFHELGAGLAIVHLFKTVFPWRDLCELNFQELNV